MESKLGQIPCSVKQFVKTVSLVGEDRKARIRQLGFDSLLSIQEVKLRKSLLKSIIEGYDLTDDRVTIVSGNSFRVSHDDVYIITGLENRGNLVQIDMNITPSDVPEKYKIRYNEDGIYIGDLIQIMYDNGPPDDDFDRSFVLYLMGTILAPVSRNRIPISYYSLVQDVTKIRNMNWNEFTLRFMKEDLANLKAGFLANRWPYGNLAILQYIYWEKVRPWGTNFFYFGRQPPLVKYWDEVTATKRDLYDMAYGSSTLMIVDDLKIKPSMEQIHLSTPVSMVDNSSVQFQEITNRLSSIDSNLARCLEREFNSNDGGHQMEDAGDSVARRVIDRKRKKKD